MPIETSSNQIVVERFLMAAQVSISVMCTQQTKLNVVRFEDLLRNVFVVCYKNIILSSLCKHRRANSSILECRVMVHVRWFSGLRALLFTEGSGFKFLPKQKLAS